MQIKLANPRGFCAGVDRAINIVEQALEIFGAPVYVRHEVVHNKYVIEELKKEGAIFVDELSEIETLDPENTVVIFSAHGVSKAVQEEAKQRKFKVFDATCPLVTKVHMEVHKYSRNGQECILIGHAGHPEVEGTMGQYREDFGGKMYLIQSIEDVDQLIVLNPDQLAYVTQTTLSMDDTARIIDALRKKFPNITGPQKDDICYATQNRQDALKSLVDGVDLILVVGSKSSSNSNRLREVAEQRGVKAYLIESADDIQPEWFNEHSVVGLSSGASTPEILVKAVLDRLETLGAPQVVEQQGRPENVTFSLPKALQRAVIARSG